MAGAVISVIVTAFVTGALARLALPGPDPMPIWLTVAIGLGGSLIGGAIAYSLAGRDPAWISIGGFLAAVTIVGLYRRFVQRRPIFGRDAYRFPERGIGVEQYRERLHRAGIDPDRIGMPFAPPVPGATVRADGSPAIAHEDPTENPAHFLGLLEELHDSGVLDDDEYNASRTRLLERLRA
ncbi:MAG TPA: SHOCT domain-containing protein [Gaiellaceae bacterium]|nr:SHOCT domain-containing protein [Gaiellaceae bacterium]